MSFSSAQLRRDASSEFLEIYDENLRRTVLYINRNQDLTKSRKFSTF